MSVPRFTPAPPVVSTYGNPVRTYLDPKAQPECRLCGERGLVDTSSRACRSCWRGLLTAWLCSLTAVELAAVFEAER